MSRLNDVGGREGFGPLTIDPESEHDFDSLWEAQLTVLVFTFTRAGVFSLDEFRDAMETIDPKQYYALPYYQRWLHALETCLAAKGLLDHERVEHG